MVRAPDPSRHGAARLRSRRGARGGLAECTKSDGSISGQFPPATGKIGPIATPDEILDFWFGTLDELGQANRDHATRWFTSDPSFDEEIRQRFAADHAAVKEGQREAWLDDARGTVAYVVLLDQFSRNLFRNTPRMYDFDDQALAAAVRGIERGFDREVPFDMRGFLYMPLMHAENLAMQERCVKLFEALRDEVDGPRRARTEGALAYAIKHRDIVATFGRFPHRNPLLGRTSTGAEMQFLMEPGSSF